MRTCFRTRSSCFLDRGFSLCAMGYGRRARTTTSVWLCRHGAKRRKGWLTIVTRSGCSKRRGCPSYSHHGGEPGEHRWAGRCMIVWGYTTRPIEIAGAARIDWTDLFSDREGRRALSMEQKLWDSRYIASTPGRSRAEASEPGNRPSPS